MKYAVFQTGGKQYRVSEGDVLEIERLTTSANSSIVYDTVMLYVDERNVVLGRPYIDGVSIKGTVLRHIRGNKIRVAKYKAKVRYRKVYGHRQAISQIKIDSIEGRETFSQPQGRDKLRPSRSSSIKSVKKQQ